MVQVEASLLSADDNTLVQQAREAEDGGADGVQIDVMDGRFVPGIRFGPDTVRALRPFIRGILDVHLMIVTPRHNIKAYATSGADRVIVHREACAEGLRTVLADIRKRGLEAAVSINPETPAAVLENLWDAVDAVQVMTVRPGLGGQPFLHGQIEKIRGLKSRIQDLGLEIPIIVDGGITTETAPLAVRAGAAILVAGSAIYNSRGTAAENIAALRQSIAGLKAP